MESWVTLMLGAAGIVGSSTGLWAYIQNRRTKQTADRDLILGLARNALVTTGRLYITRGYVTHDEYDVYEHDLYLPYKKLGGNGLGDKIMDAVKQLPFSAAENPVVQTLKEKANGRD